MSIPVLGKGPENQNPLLVLAGAMEGVRGELAKIVENTKPDASAGIPHRYGLTIVETEEFGKMWGSLCIGCTYQVGEFVYPCQVEDDPLKPPQFFTIGRAFGYSALGVFEPAEQSTQPTS